MCTCRPSVGFPTAQTRLGRELESGLMHLHTFAMCKGIRGAKLHTLEVALNGGEHMHTLERCVNVHLEGVNI